MKKLLVLVLAPLALVAAHAATSTDSAGVTTSDDPAKAAAVERHAQELAATRDNKSGMEGKAVKTTHKRHHRQHHAAKASAKK